MTDTGRTATVNLEHERQKASAVLGEQISVRRAAELVGVAQRTWQRWEAKESLPRAVLDRFWKEVTRETRQKGPPS